jgi:hypothetical protein
LGNCRANKTLQWIPTAKLRIEFLLFRTPVDDKEREIFLKHIPYLMENIPFSFIQETLEQHEKQLQDEKHKSSSDLQDEKSEDFALPNDSESVDTEVIDSQKEIKSNTDKFASIITAYEDINEEGDVISETMEDESPYQKKQIPKKAKEMIIEEISPIFKMKRQRITRFDAEEWGRVAALLLAAIAKGRINWKNLQPQIGGGHPISTLKDWC